MDIKQAYREIMEALSDVMTIEPAGNGKVLSIKKPFRDIGGFLIPGLFFV